MSTLVSHHTGSIQHHQTTFSTKIHSAARAGQASLQQDDSLHRFVKRHIAPSGGKCSKRKRAPLIYLSCSEVAKCWYSLSSGDDFQAAVTLKSAIPGGNGHTHVVDVPLPARSLHHLYSKDSSTTLKSRTN